MFQRDYYNFFSIKSLQKMNSQTLNFFVNLCEKNENPVCECVVNHSGFCSYPDTDPTRGSDPDLDPIPDPSRSRSGPEGTRIRNILTSPKIQVFFSLLLLQNYKYLVFPDSTLRASATGATYAYSSRALKQPHRLGGQLQQVILKFLSFLKKKATLARIRIRIRQEVWFGFEIRFRIRAEEWFFLDLRGSRSATLLSPTTKKIFTSIKMFLSERISRAPASGATHAHQEPSDSHTGLVANTDR